MDQIIIAKIDLIAKSISTQQLGLVHHCPENWAKPIRCFENAAHKASINGGRVQFGWTFHHRQVEHIPGPGYIFLTHHAVWHSPSEALVDVTPYPLQKHRPISPSGSTLFLIDDMAQPIINGKIIAPRPLQFFAVDETPAMQRHVFELNMKEQEQCIAIYNA